MIEVIRINSLDSEYLSSLVELYMEAFPEEERRDIKQLKEYIISKENMFFNAILFDNELCGLFVYWNFKEFSYLEHLAIFSDKRNLKIGEKLLSLVEANLPGLRLLEVMKAETS